MFAALRQWVEQRRAMRRRWQADTRALVSLTRLTPYYEAQRRAARVRGDRAEFFHLAKVAAEVARLTPRAEMDVDVVRAIAGGEERRQG
jgi:hypothetical protein